MKICDTEGVAAAVATVRILVVVDQEPFRDAVRAVVERLDGFDIVAEAHSGEEAVEAVEAIAPDLVFMDINMGGIDGIEATRRITAAHPEVLVVLMSTYELSDLPPGAQRSGRPPT